jgi:glutamate--cysteine ligase
MELSPEDLLGFFEAAEKPDVADHRIGTELETFGVHVGTPDSPADMPTPVRFTDHVEPVLRGLMDRHGWEPGITRGTEGQLVELLRDGASITLEPGGQLELSGKPLPTVHHTCAEFTQHYNEMHDVSSPLGVTWMAAGFHPWATRD